MSSPFNPGRDSNAAQGASFDTSRDLDPADVGAFQDSFRPPSDPLSEQDYRTPDHGGGAGTDNVVPERVAGQSPQRFTYPTQNPGGGVL